MVSLIVYLITNHNSAQVLQAVQVHLFYLISNLVLAPG